MNPQKSPWLEKWQVIRTLGRGGQGETALVRSILDGDCSGVLKTLRNNKSNQARSRIRMEVSTLEMLSVRGIKVPSVIDSNVDRFKDDGLPLYFVMQYIEGGTLKEIIEMNGPLTLEKAAAIVLDLSETMAAAHDEGVSHRDLKPANIIVRNEENGDCVIVDYGLSFNSGDDGETLTLAGEQFRNEFLALGETNTPGGNKRDPRIDVTALCAVFYFCLTASFPGQIIDGRARPPHRRDGVNSVRHHISGDHRCNQVEMLFDRGFAPDIERRFQSCSELTTRVRDVVGVPRDKSEDPIVLAAFFGRELQEQDRKTQLQT